MNKKEKLVINDCLFAIYPCPWKMVLRGSDKCSWLEIRCAKGGTVRTYDAEESKQAAEIVNIANEMYKTL